MERSFQSLREFNYLESSKHLWVFKRSKAAECFSARYAQTDDRLNNLLLSAVQSEVDRITETARYTHLAQTNESNCLWTPTDGSDFECLRSVVNRPEPEWRARSVKDLTNAAGYVVKFTHDGETVYAVKRLSTNWKASRRKNLINTVFADGELSAVEDDGFAIEKTFDFYAFRDFIFIASKAAFETSMAYRVSYVQAFESLRVNPGFTGMFSDLEPLVRHVGSNAIQLRRMARIEERALYTRPDFLATVRSVSDRRKWGLKFDDAGRLVPCDATAKTIVQIFLDHRLLSEVTDLNYDVPDATQL